MNGWLFSTALLQKSCRRASQEEQHAVWESPQHAKATKSGNWNCPCEKIENLDFWDFPGKQTVMIKYSNFWFFVLLQSKGFHASRYVVLHGSGDDLDS